MKKILLLIGSVTKFVLLSAGVAKAGDYSYQKMSFQKGYKYAVLTRKYGWALWTGFLLTKSR